ncbi:MAG: phosphoribosyltransferase family protein [bacterium]
MSINLLKEQLERAKIVKEGDYEYLLSSITEQSPAIDPAILEDCGNKLMQKLNYKKATKILTAESMGIPISIVLSLKTGLPLIIATKRKKRTFDEISVDYICGYENGYLDINNIGRNEKIIIIDDLISSGKTIFSMIETVDKIGATVEDIGAIFSKSDFSGIKELKKVGFRPKILLDVRFRDGRPEVEIIG